MMCNIHIAYKADTARSHPGPEGHRHSDVVPGGVNLPSPEREPWCAACTHSPNARSLVPWMVFPAIFNALSALSAVFAGHASTAAAGGAATAAGGAMAAKDAGVAGAAANSTSAGGAAKVREPTGGALACILGRRPSLN